jgi:hypothetical protein
MTILALVYLTSTLGATVRLDCCLEKLVQVGLGATDPKMQWFDDAKDNCKDDHKQVKLGHEQKRTDSKIRVAKIVPATLNTDHTAYSARIVSALLEKYPVNNAPPKPAIVPLFNLYCVYRI